MMMKSSIPRLDFTVQYVQMGGLVGALKNYLPTFGVRNRLPEEVDGVHGALREFLQ
jgi:hypothetical protein